jgi:CRP-like cAMP-binding protein
MTAAQLFPFKDTEVQRTHRFPIFASMSQGELESVLSKGERSRYRKGETVCLEDEPGEDFYLVLQGKGKRLRIPPESLGGSA